MAKKKSISYLCCLLRYYHYPFYVHFKDCSEYPVLKSEARKTFFTFIIDSPEQLDAALQKKFSNHC